MEIPMTQDETNQAEWQNPENWSGSVLGIYFSKADTRIWVPKKPKWAGWTLNLAKPAGVWWLFILLLLPFFILLGILITTGLAGKS